MPLRGGHGVILFIALIERRYVLFMEKTSENTVQVWKNKKIKHWMLIAFFLCFYDIVVVNLSYIFGLFIRFDLTFSAIPKEYMLAYVKFAPIYTAFCVVVFLCSSFIIVCGDLLALANCQGYFWPRLLLPYSRLWV